VSLLNDGKYGHDIHENVMRLTLLRSSTLPDHEADQGLHTFTYALLPHSGCWGTETQAAAYALNNPILLLNSNDQSTAKPPASLTFPLIESDRSNVIIETVKASEDGSGIVYRLYESQRHRGEVWLWLGYPVKAVWRTNFLEEKHSKLTVDDNHAVTLTIKPYEIVTLLVIREE
jgi:alpha-mannosidase